MIVHNELESFKPSETARPRVLTSGVFDGLHEAHCRLVRRVVDLAHAPSGARVSPGARVSSGGVAMVLTFSNHPLSVLAPPYLPKRLISPLRKRDLLEKMGVDVLLAPEFTSDFAAIGPEEFAENILVNRLAADHVVVGFDCRFGRNGEGDARLLAEMGRRYGFEVEILPAVYHDEWPISSTRIRELIAEGRMRQVSDMLGRPYDLSGKVIRGCGRGAELGFPTANLRFDPDSAVPASGVYAVFAATAQRRYRGMMNIGSSPTFAGAEYRPEVYLFDYEGGDLYGETLQVHFVDRLREERRFPSSRALQERLRVDERMARAILEAESGRLDGA
ncbi:MAG TPA: riboflavin biosynthesis protein RibF [Sumerlaeia bacterium]|nr:riboflavin biosynthesis protein RibF [Sumerlaeia bacterium]